MPFNDSVKTLFGIIQTNFLATIQASFFFFQRHDQFSRCNSTLYAESTALSFNATVLAFITSDIRLPLNLTCNLPWKMLSRRSSLYIECQCMQREVPNHACLPIKVALHVTWVQNIDHGTVWFICCEPCRATKTPQTAQSTTMYNKPLILVTLYNM